MLILELYKGTKVAVANNHGDLTRYVVLKLLVSRSPLGRILGTFESHRQVG